MKNFNLDDPMVLQELHSGLRVRVRDDRWRIQTVIGWSDCAEVRLTGIAALNDAEERTLLAPFDRFDPIDAPGGSPVRVSRRRWMRALAGAAAAARPAAGLQAADRAAIDLLPWQLEPAMALVSGAASRVLIADAVGMGKTVQALAALAELAARREAERVLVVVPAGLRDQWAGELTSRFRFASTIVDAAFLAGAARDLPPSINPWSLPGVHLVSLDFLKRAEVVRGVEDLCWDLVIADEAHLAAPATDRLAALDRVARRAARVILLTATPYAADAHGYAALCGIGHGSARITQATDHRGSSQITQATDHHGSPQIPQATDRHGSRSTVTATDLLVFRRTRLSVSVAVPPRRTRVLRVRLTPAERRLHRLIERYTARVWREAPSSAARLAMIVLRKRALSSAWAVGRSIEHRMALLHAPDRVELQAPLPFDLDEDGETSVEDTVPDAIVGAPGLADARAERTMLAALVEAAATAAQCESKVRVLARLLGRTREPAIVFTEYRDTLGHLAEQLTDVRTHAVLHGGLSRAERAAAASALDTEAIRLLLATDAAGEGLNLHRACRWVINFELPWNPARLEQRAGRIDRYGQRRTPHALHLVARDTAESVVLATLEARIRRAHQAGWLDEVWPTERTVAATIVGRDPLAINAIASVQPPAVPVAVTALAARACTEALRRSANSWRGRGTARPKSDARADVTDRPFLVEIEARRLARPRSALDRLVAAGGTLSIFRAEIHDGAGHVVDSTVVGAFGEIPAESRLPLVRAFHTAAIDGQLARWHAIAAVVAAGGRPEIQPALFDRRAVDRAMTLDAAHAALARELESRIERLERSRVLTVEPPELLLVARPARRTEP